MTTLTRVTAKLFGGSAPSDEIGQFGSAKAGTKLNTSDVATIQALSAYSQGWGSAIISSRNFPPIEEVTGVLKTLSYQNCYLLQEGIPTYDANTEYSNTSIVKDVSGSELLLYLSKVNGNIGNSLSNGTYWTRVQFSGTTPIGAPIFTLNFSATLPAGHIELNGATVSRSTYNNLFAIYGTTYGAGDGSTTFTLPDFRNRVIWGGTSAGYVDAGLPSISLSSAGSHNHTFSGNTQTGYAYCLGNSNSPCDGTMCVNTGVYSTESQGDGGSGKDAKMTITITPSGSIGYNGSHTHTATGSLYGNSTTVQPPAIKVRVYTRYQ